jgi:hypothetical protein
MGDGIRRDLKVDFVVVASIPSKSRDRCMGARDHIHSPHLNL